jgi:hypothetical protein
MHGCACGFFTSSRWLWITHILTYPGHHERDRYPRAR